MEAQQEALKAAEDRRKLEEENAKLYQANPFKELCHTVLALATEARRNGSVHEALVLPLVQ